MDRDALRDALAMEYIRGFLAEDIPLRAEFREVTRDAYAFADAALDAREAAKRKEAA